MTAHESLKKKDRLDQLLVGRGLVSSREEARRLILAGKVLVDEGIIDRPGTKMPADVAVRIKEKLHPYVSRGGVKLASALDKFDIDPTGKAAIDLGASTGGFTDCLLQRGAARVYAVDVGYGQLDHRLRSDPRVIVMERTNARYLSRKDFPEPADIVTMDVSFISSLKMLKAVGEILDEQGDVVSLAKPQFEIGREKVGKGGVVRSPEDHREVLRSLRSAFVESGFVPVDLTYSPIPGPKGNLEFWFHLRRQGTIFPEEKTDRVVQEAHSCENMSKTKT